MNFLLFLFFISKLDIILTKDQEEMFKLRVLYQNSVPNRKIEVTVKVQFDNAEEIIGIKLSNGTNVEFELPPNADQTEKVALDFTVYITPQKDECAPEDERQNGAEHPSDTTPNLNVARNVRARLFQTMRRSVVVALYKPNFSKRYTVNLGSMESSEIYWHRRIFMETKCGDILPGNFHAFLYAYARKNRPENVNLYEMPEQQKLLGYAPMVLNTLGNMPSTADNAIQQQRISEYRLSIPIVLKSLFKHKILSLSLYVFQYNESDLKENDVEMNKNSNESDQSEMCPICLDPLLSSQREKLHWAKGQNHAFHSDCIKKWIEIREKIRCPLCNKEPELKIVGECLPIFSGPSEAPPLDVYANPLAELCRRAQNAADGTFVKAQSQFALDSIVRRLSKAETAVRHLLANDLHFLLLVGDDQPLFSIGSEGFVENGQFLQNIRKALENPQKILQKYREKFHKALALIQWAKIFQSSEANDALESMQLISEET